jgi:hypothetical protein
MSDFLNIIKMFFAFLYFISLIRADCDANQQSSLYAFEDGSNLNNVVNYLKFNQKFKYFKKEYSGLKIGKNGACLLVNKRDFNDDFLLFNLSQSNKPFIAPFWSDIKDYDQIFYKIVNDESVLKAILFDINCNERYKSFNSKSAVLITWFEVLPYGYATTNRNTFQLVLIANEKFSFIIFKYGLIEWTHSKKSKNIIGYNSGIGKIFDLTNTIDIKDGNFYKIFRVDSEGNYNLT